MNFEIFEKQVKSIFDRYRPEADNEQIWQNIEPQLKRKKKRRPFFLIFWGLCLGLLLTFVWWQHLGKTSFENQRLASKHEQGQNSLSAEQKPQAETRLEVEKSSAPGIHEQVAAGNSVSKTLEGKGVFQKTTSVENAYLQQIEEKELAAKNFSAQPLAKGSLTTEASIQGSMTTEGKADAAQNSLIPKMVAVSLPVQEPEASPDQEAEANASPDLNTESKATPKDTLAGNSENKKTDIAPKAKKHSKPKKMGRTKPHKRKRNKAAISLHGGYVLPIKTMKRNEHVEENGDLLANRKASEKMLEAFSASVNFTYATKKGLLFRGGLDYKRLNEKFRVSYANSETKIVTGVLTQTVNSEGQVISQTFGDKEVTTTTVYSNTAYSNYQFWNMPLGMGFQRLNKKSQLEIAGGVDINLLFRFDGTLYNEFAQPVTFSHPGYEGIFRRNLGFGIWASYGYSRNLSRNIRWQLSVKADAPFASITSKKYPLIQRYYNIGLQGGLVFNLTKEKKSKHKKRK